jgi:hypothetical protein
MVELAIHSLVTGNPSSKRRMISDGRFAVTARSPAALITEFISTSCLQSIIYLNNILHEKDVDRYVYTDPSRDLLICLPQSNKVDS